jgi:hypothetical protein
MIDPSSDLLKILWVVMLGIVAKAEADAREYDDLDEGDNDRNIK